MSTLTSSDLDVTDVNCTNLKDASGNNSNTPAAINSGIVRAWIDFDGSSGSIGTGNASFNIASVTDHGTGVYTINIDTDFGSANWVAAGMCGADNTTTHFVGTGNAAPTAGALKIQTVNDGGGAIDCTHIMVMMIGAQ